MRTISYSYWLRLVSVVYFLEERSVILKSTFEALVEPNFKVDMLDMDDEFFCLGHYWWNYDEINGAILSWVLW